jgi:hypothetical protein
MAYWKPTDMALSLIRIDEVLASNPRQMISLHAGIVHAFNRQISNDKAPESIIPTDSLIFLMPLPLYTLFNPTTISVRGITQGGGDEG